MNSPKFKSRPKRSRSAEALSRLRGRWQMEHEGEEWEAEDEPLITPMLKAVDGGVGHVLTALRSHDDDDARSFCELYDSLTASDKCSLSIEQIAFASGLARSASQRSPKQPSSSTARCRPR